MSEMSPRQLRRVFLPVMALFLALVLTVTVGMLSSAEELDDYFGRGERTVATLGDAAGLDTEYYPRLYAGRKKSQAAAAEVSRRISDGGIVLLKNSGLLPLDRAATVSPLGLRYYLPYYGGKGSSTVDPSADYIVTPREGLHSVFGSVNATLEDTLFSLLEGGQALSDNAGLACASPLLGGREDQRVFEFKSGAYQEFGTACKGTVGVVFVGRQTGEDCDAFPGRYDDGTPHMLALTEAERAAIAFAKANCDGLVVVLASSSPMEIAALEEDSGVDAILWMGGAGSSGYRSLADILVGDVVPSGRTGDIWPADLSRDPTFANLDDGSDRFVYSNAFTTLVGNTTAERYGNAPFHEYEEGVYLGYKYYETAYDIGALEDYHSPVNGVLYPFGYGLSYARFEQRILSWYDWGDAISLTVRVRNTGDRYTGRDVVQVYFTAPYTRLDQDYGIEKPTAVLAAFGKTGAIPPGGYEDVLLSFQKEDMASYCTLRATGCYMLEEGSYVVSLRANSHDVLDSRTTHVPVTLWYDGSSPRRSEANTQAAVNRFGQLAAYMTDPSVSGVTVLSRGDWAGTQPTAPTGADRTASATVAAWLAESDTMVYDSAADRVLGNVPGSPVYRANAPTTGAKNDIVLADLRGRDYNDPRWDLLLDQLTFTDREELRQCLFEAAYQTGALKEIGKPESMEHDGPQGLTQPDLSGRNWLTGTCAYPSAPVMAATWDRALMYDFGNMVGQEALLAGINGWYAPGLNLRRSPFGGRAAEYFSEDPLLAGELATRVVSGAGDAGLSCAVKHLALMDTEGHRNPHTSVWLTEQALREVYLRPFELVVKHAVKTVRYIDGETGILETRTMPAGDFLMTGDCAIGPRWTSASYELLTEVVRGEWGFRGLMISDMNLNSSSQRVDAMLRAGCDALMSTSAGRKATLEDLSSPTGMWLARGAIKNMCYTLVNSGLMQGAAPGSVIQYAISPWKLSLAVCDAIAALLLIAGGLWLAWRTRPARSVDNPSVQRTRRGRSCKREGKPTIENL